MTQELEIAICAMQRSGHHAVMDWVAAMLKNKYGAGNILRVNWVNQLAPQIDPFDTKYPATGADRYKYRPEQRDTPRKVLMYNFEDAPVSTMAASAMYSKQYTGESAKRLTMFIVRDVYNLMASRIARTRKGKPFSHPHTTAVALWMEHVACCFEQVNHPGLRHQEHVLIKYNTWFEDEGYRRSCADLLGCEYTEETMDVHNPAGEGSSFGDRHLSGRQLPVTSRWEEYKDDPIFIACTNNPDVQRLNGRMFGWYLDMGSNGEYQAVPYV